MKSYRQTFFCLPLTVRLKHPSLSPDSESAPHCNTTALGWYISITLDIIYNQHKIVELLIHMKKINPLNETSIFLESLKKNLLTGLNICP